MADAKPQARVNLEKASVLLLDDSSDGMAIIVQILTGFGVKKIERCSTLLQAQDIACQWDLDLTLVNANMPEDQGYDFISWLRRAPSCEANRFTSAMMLSGHTRLSSVKKARDCGANFIVAKPLSPSTLMDRLLWVAREKRPFVVCDTYAGPDRRFKDKGPPEGLPGRRSVDKFRKEESEPAAPSETNEPAPQHKRDAR